MNRYAPRFRFAVLLFFVGSGAASLVLEVVWARSLGGLAPLEIDFARVQRLFEREELAADLREIAINDVYDLLDCHVCDAAAVEKIAAGVRQRELALAEKVNPGEVHDRLAGICLRTGRPELAEQHMAEALRLRRTIRCIARTAAQSAGRDADCV